MRALLLFALVSLSSATAQAGDNSCQDIPTQSAISALPSVVGFSKTDLLVDTLTYQISALDSWTPPENAPLYFEVAHSKKCNGFRLWELIDTRRPRSAKASTFTGAEPAIGEDLEPAIADSMRAPLKARDRLEVARAISLKVRGMLSSDSQAMEFATLFRRISNSLGIPARLVNGYLLDSEGVIPHVWVEVKSNDRTWSPLDPMLSDGDTLPSLGYFPSNSGEVQVFKRISSQEGMASQVMRKFGL